MHNDDDWGLPFSPRITTGGTDWRAINRELEETPEIREHSDTLSRSDTAALGEDSGVHEQAAQEMDNGTQADTTPQTVDDITCDYSPKTWLEVLPSQTGTILAAILANVMAEGLNSNQQGLLGDFISAVGSLISYISDRNTDEN